MKMTGKLVANRLAAYLRHDISCAELVDWAENAVMEGDFAEEDVRDVVARLGVSDVRDFGLTWEDCEALLNKLGYSAHVDVVAK